MDEFIHSWINELMGYLKSKFVTQALLALSFGCAALVT